MHAQEEYANATQKDSTMAPSSNIMLPFPGISQLKDRIKNQC